MDALGQQLAKITHGCSEIISVAELKKKLARSLENRIPLKIKAGFDPTAPDIHLGHTVLLRKLRQFQDLGHTVIFLIGDFTARVGDPTGQNKTRPPMTEDDVQKNAETYKSQAFKILIPQKTEVVFNNEWFSRMSLENIFELMKHVSVSQTLARADFRKRLKDNTDIRMSEFMYPLLQAYDSVHLKADIEIGGTDQKFNLLLGRELQTDFHQEPQVVMMLSLLEGIDGVQKMSKSLGNYVGINEPPDEIFGKVMSIGDTLMYTYFELLTDEDMEKVKSMHPKEAKEYLAFLLVSQYYGYAQADTAKAKFKKTFTHKEIPVDIPEFKIGAKGRKVIDALVESAVVKSKNEARRLIQQGAITFLDAKITDEHFVILQSGTLKAGSRRFVKIIIE